MFVVNHTSMGKPSKSILTLWPQTSNWCQFSAEVRQETYLTHVPWRCPKWYSCVLGVAQNQTESRKLRNHYWCSKEFRLRRWLAREHHGWSCQHTFQELVTLVPIDISGKIEEWAGIVLDSGYACELASQSLNNYWNLLTCSSVERNLQLCQSQLRPVKGTTYSHSNGTLAILDFSLDRRSKRPLRENRYVRKFKRLYCFQVVYLNVLKYHEHGQWVYVKRNAPQASQ